MALIRHKHRNEPEWDPGTPDEFAAGMLMRQAQDLSMGYRTRGMFGTSWKEYGRLSAATQGKFEGHVLRMVTISHARRSAQVAAFNRKFDDRPIPTTKEEADRLMADMISEVIGRRVEPPRAGARDVGARPRTLLDEPVHGDRDDVHREQSRLRQSTPCAAAPRQRTVGIDRRVPPHDRGRAPRRIGWRRDPDRAR